MATILGNARTFGRFAFQAAPILWQRMSEDRKRSVQPSPHIPRLWEWSGKGLHAAWIGHSTVLIRVDGFTILTDPVFSARIGIRIGPLTLGMKRLVRPALDLSEVGVPDLILLS